MSDKRHVRRRYPRAQISSPGFLLLDGGQPVGPFLVENLSAGGALLTGGTSIPVGATALLQLRLPGRSHPMNVAATVVRGTEGAARNAHGASFAVKFRELSPEDEDAIQSAVLRTLEESREHGESAVLVLDESIEDRHALAGALVGLGQRACAVDTFLDGLRLLQDQNLRIEVALVDLLVRQRSGLDVLTFLAEDFPGVRRVLVTRDGSAPELELARSSGKAQSILIKPCETKDLAAALGLSEVFRP